MGEGALPPGLYLRRYLRTGRVAWCADLRSFCDVGGRREVLRSARSGRAVETMQDAVRAYEGRVRLLEQRRRRLSPDALGYDPLLSHMVDHFLAVRARHGDGRGSTLRRHATALRHVCGAFPPRTRLSDVTPGAVLRYVERRREAKGLREHTRVSDNTILNEIGALSAVYTLAVLLGAWNANPCRGLGTYRPQRQVAAGDVLTRPELARLLDAATVVDHQSGLPAGRTVGLHEVLVAMLAYTGLRHGELVGLLVRDVDLRERLLHVRPNDYRGLKRPWHSRAIPLPGTLCAILRAYLVETGRVGGLLFPGRQDGLRPSIAGHIRRAAVQAGLEGRKLSPHTLRHTFATMARHTLVEIGNRQLLRLDATEVAAMLGHRSSRLLEEVYLNRTARMDLMVGIDAAEHLRATPAMRGQVKSPLRKRAIS
jgi:integrase